MKCKNCNKEMSDDLSYCSYCGAVLGNPNIGVNNRPKKHINRDRNICLILYIFCVIFAFLLNPIFYLLALIILTIAVTRCPKSIILKVFFWINMCIFLFLIGYLIFSLYTWRCPD